MTGEAEARHEGLLWEPFARRPVVVWVSSEAQSRAYFDAVKQALRDGTLALDPAFRSGRLVEVSVVRRRS